MKPVRFQGIYFNTYNHGRPRQVTSIEFYIQDRFINSTDGLRKPTVLRGGIYQQGHPPKKLEGHYEARIRAIEDQFVQSTQAARQQLSQELSRVFGQPVQLELDSLHFKLNPFVPWDSASGKSV